MIESQKKFDRIKTAKKLFWCVGFALKGLRGSIIV